jgi:hypothetical protein
MSPTVFRWRGYRFYFFSRAEARLALAVESLTAADRYPLVSRVRSNKRLQLARAQRKPRRPPTKRARPRS